jgi:hypothetical protein
MREGVKRSLRGLAVLAALITLQPACGAGASTQAADAALATSILALGVTTAQTLFLWQQSRIQEDQRNASVWPRLQIFRSTGTAGTDDDAGTPQRRVGFGLVNKGVGPAVVRAFRVSLDGHDVSDAVTFLQKAYGREGVGSYNSSTVLGSVLSPTERVSVVEVVGDDEAIAPVRDAIMAGVGGGSRRLTVSVCYCSVFNQCWWETLDLSEPRSTPFCPPADTNAAKRW